MINNLLLALVLMSWPNSLKIYTDGACRGNPGPSSVGVSFSTLENQEIAFISEYIGETTNNVAEYTALLKALKKAKEEGVENIWVCTDSELMVKQLKGEYKVKADHIRTLHSEAFDLLKSFRKVKLEHVLREKNKRADALANQALDSLSGLSLTSQKSDGLFDDDFE